MEETISLQELFQVLKKRAALILIITIIAALVAGMFSSLCLTPKYQVSSQILVNKAESENSIYSSNEVSTNVQLINTYNEIIKSPAVLQSVIDDLELDLTIEELNKKISVSSANNSQVMNIVVEDESILNAVNIANKTAQVFKEKIVDIMNVNNVTILSKARVKGNESPVSPNTLLNTAIGLVVGLMASIGLAFLLEYLDNTFKTEKDIEKHLELPILGVIPTFEGLE
ncbi:capsular biosynthesis protein [Bacillus sp. AGMB 02131]|uniref:Capsular biosynthesis protein n=2 Tax=Peribacillus faecalis TaxID=2772559 RepID=A0A927CU47_9BACI|nr:capsular biosynthesis protein [Peribacillus faecalis]